MCIADQCMYGLRVPGKDWKTLMPAKKTTKTITNSPCIARELQRRCYKNHVHQLLKRGRAKKAGIYPPALCHAICTGLKNQKVEDECCVKFLMSVNHTTKIEQDTDPERRPRGLDHDEHEEVGIQD